MPAPAAPRLVARRVDGWLVGWLAVVIWASFSLAAHAGYRIGGSGVSTLYWVGAVVGAAHFGLSYHLAYSDGIRSAVRRRPFALGIGPMLIALALAVAVVWSLRSGPIAASRLTGAFITSVYLFTTWHYIKQAYGVARVGAAFAGIKLTANEAKVLRFALYPAWWLGASVVLERGAHYSLAHYSIGYQLLPAAAIHALRWGASAAFVPIGVAIVRACLRAGRMPSAIFAAPYAAALCWLVLPTSPALLVLFLAPLHALQYLAIGHRAEVSLAATRAVPVTAAWWLNIFGGAAAGGLLISRWLPAALDTHLSTAGGPMLFAAAGFVFLNLHHYLIDAVIWRSSGELVKAVVRPPQPMAIPQQAPALAPGSVAQPATA
jgi:hypothetical protein